MKKLLMIGVATALVLTGCTKGPESGKRYENSVLEGVNSRYNEKFVVVDRLEQLEGDQYQPLVVAPERDANLQFFAANSWGTPSGAPFPSRSVWDQYADGIFYTYAPDLYEKHLGFKPDYSYFVEDLRYGAEDGYSKANEYTIRGVNVENLKQISEGLHEVIAGLIPHFPPNYQYSNEQFFIPIQFDIPGDSDPMYYYTVSIGSTKSPESFDIYNSLKTSYESHVMEQKKKEVGNSGGAN
ncbi:MAG TPA: hypothetical protein VE710_25510 [Candidatus Bathyarchaeia archaeon]|nr:hypothetical protein [Candidatus Bathyarchaeia archaeon]